MPRCPDCGMEKPAQDFPRNRSTKSGLATYCKPCHNARWRVSIERKGGSREYHLRSRYRLTSQQVDEMIAAQGGVCAVCKRKPAVQVDHDHKTGRVRGVLCDGCNGGMGHFNDDPELIRRAIAYVKRFQ